jgi:septal ring factor EnvC (AmiA/AmiB activator)
MAAKQGLTAQLSQAGEDAKRAVLSRTGVTSSWFSNLNTVCTIKSAPPRSPDVLQMLATKSGWLFKRNEQHVWQARWCCIVPHSFLYYFDANVVPGQAPPIPNPTPQQQESWNKAVQLGYGNRKQHEKRGSLYLFNGQNNANEEPEGGSAGPEPSKLSSSHPAGIIDLECYTSVHRSSADKHVLELAGDDQVNPDLRPFYFCTGSDTESEHWTDSLLNCRHSALLDECEAYKQVCDGFAQQLQGLHTDLDGAARVQEECQDELYRVRSSQEDVRRSCWRLMEDSLERPVSDLDPRILEKRAQFQRNLGTVRTQDMGIPQAVRLLLEYLQVVEEVSIDLHCQKERLRDNLQQTGQSDQVKVEELTKELEELKNEFLTEKQQWQAQVDTATAKYQQSQKELKDVEKDLSSTRMEVTMYQSQQKTKLSEVQQHKKILKKEVIDLRSRLENAMSELSMMRHQQESHKMQAEQEREKNSLLERYVEKMESQVKVQQNMMEMMSQSGVGSVVGGSIGPFDHRSYASRSRNNIVVVHRGRDESENVDNDNEAEDVARGLPFAKEEKTSDRRNLVEDIDNKSHMSELTEDRTQRHYEAFTNEYSPYRDLGGSSPNMNGTRQNSSSQRTPGPPTYIGVGSFPQNHLEASRASKKHSPQAPRVRRNDIPRPSGVHDTSPIASKKASVAQLTRLEAEKQSTPSRARVDENNPRQEQAGRSPGLSKRHGKTSSSRSVKSQGSRIWKRMEEAVLGPLPDERSSDEDDSSGSINSNGAADFTEEGDNRNRLAGDELSDEKKMTESVSHLSLHERSKLQREKQLQFLKEQGLVKDKESSWNSEGPS